MVRKLTCEPLVCKLTCDDGVEAIASSARKHGMSDQDMLHAYANPIRSYEVDEGLVMLIGPDRSARMLEIGVVDGDLAPVIVTP